MDKNMGTLDRSVRSSVAVIIAGLIATRRVTGGWALALGGLAFILGATSAVGFCPAYAPFGATTRSND